jgi:hypothetical protein
MIYTLKEVAQQQTLKQLKRGEVIRPQLDEGRATSTAVIPVSRAEVACTSLPSPHSMAPLLLDTQGREWYS